MQRSWWGACVGHFSGNYLIYFLLTWMPFYLVRERNFSMNKMARIGGVAFLLCALASLLSGPIVDRWIASGTSPTRVHKTMLVVGLVGSGLLLVLCVLATPVLSIVLLLAGSGFYGLSNPHIFACAQALAGPRAAGKWMGLQNFVGNFAGIVAPALTGFLVDRTHHFFWPFAVTGIVAADRRALVGVRRRPHRASELAGHIGSDGSAEGWSVEDVGEGLANRNGWLCSG